MSRLPLKRHRPLGMHANGPRARRVLVSSGAAVPSVDSMSAVGNASSGNSVLLNMTSSDEGKGGPPSGGEVKSTPPPEDNASVTPPSMGRTSTEQNGSFPSQVERETRLACDRQKPSTICPDAQKKVHCSLAADDASSSFQSAAATSHGWKAVSGDAGILQSQVSSIKDSSLNVSVEPSQSMKADKGSLKKKYNVDSFFKVNGKFYQKLGKIGSGGSSEVYKVITSDCTIYALKRIVLKGCDYSTAYGFYQEIEYMKKLKGKSNIIQLIDYEVTNEALVEEVMKKCLPVRNGRIKDDVYIYMVLEYGEIDLAHMLLQKWKDF